MPGRPNRNTPTGQTGLGGWNSPARSPPVPCQTEVWGKAIRCSLNITSSAVVASGRMDTQTEQLLGWNDPQRELVPPDSKPCFALAGQGPCWPRCCCASSHLSTVKFVSMGGCSGKWTSNGGSPARFAPCHCVHPFPLPALAVSGRQATLLTEPVCLGLLHASEILQPFPPVHKT